MAPDTVLRAAAYLRREGLDFVAAAPRVVMPGALLQAFGVVFTLFFSLYTRPWKARDPHSRAHIGIGAFNLVRADAYRRMGTHQAIAMRPDDDMKLGKLVKKHGLSQDFLYGAGQISVEWYATLRQALRGLRKNGFAGVDYRLDRVLLATVAIALLFLVPVPAVLLTGGWTRLLFGVAIGLMLLLYAGAARALRDGGTLQVGIGGIHSENLEVQLIRARWLHLNGEPARALEHLVPVQEDREALSRHQQGELDLLAARCLLATGKPDEALETLARAQQTFAAAGAPDRASLAIELATEVRAAKR